MSLIQIKIADLIIHGPEYYSSWWRGLLREAPLHLIIETSLCFFIIWLVFIRKTVDPSKSSKKDKLSEKEVQWLLETWEPEPLVPQLTDKDRQIVDSMLVRGFCHYKMCTMVVHKILTLLVMPTIINNGAAYVAYARYHC